MSHSELPPLPSPESYFEAVTEIDKDFQAAGGPAAYLERFSTTEKEHSFTMREFEHRMSQFGLIIEPMDRSTRYLHNQGFETAQTIVKGGVAGLILVRRVQSFIPATLVLDKVRVGSPGTGDDDTDKDGIARQLVVRGWEGYDLLGEETKLLVEKWEDQVAHNRDAHMFRVGLGIVAMSACAMHQELIPMLAVAEAKQFEADVDSHRQDSYWDEELDKLLSPNDPADDPSQ